MQIIDEINYLANEGIIITTELGDFKVYFILGLILGDNLGLNCILEFSKSFSSNYYCRFCKTHKTIANKLCEEDGSSMRNANNYLETITFVHFFSIMVGEFIPDNDEVWQFY